MLGMVVVVRNVVSSGPSKAETTEINVTGVGWKNFSATALTLKNERAKKNGMGPV